VPRASTNKLYRTFVKGLITEAGPLTYPADASIAEDNCVIYQAGNRSRRLGIDFEADSDISTFNTPVENYNDIAVVQFNWMSAGNDSTKNFLVTQIGRYVYFHDLSSSPLHEGEKSFVIDLNVYSVGGQPTAQTPLSFSAGKGHLFVVGQYTEPFLVTYNSTNDAFAVQQIYIQIRDFKGLDDGLANDEEPASLTAAHEYNLLNQGWFDSANAGGGSAVNYFSAFGTLESYNQAASTPITAYHTEFSRYPGNNKQWWVAKDSTTGAFDAELLGKFYFGSTRAPRGHYIVNAFYIDRSAMSGVVGLPVESVFTRPSACAFFSGRAWYAHESTVYFSQILDDKRKAGMCYQEADPTSEDISDLIATDGGVIPIPEMIKAIKLVPIAGGVMVFASNGLWFVSGTQAGFTATDITVTKVSPIGTDSPGSIIHVQDAGGDYVLWWSKVGIQAISQATGQFGPIDNRFENTIMSQTTIQTFYNEIPKTSLPYVKAHYDPTTNVVQWLFNSGDLPYNYAYNRILNFDLTLKAFYPWTISSTSELGPFIAGVFQPITVNNSLRNKLTKYFSVTENTNTFSYRFAEENNTSFADWGTEAYTSFVETGYELMEDAMRDKQAMYVYCYFRRTEDEWISDGGDGYTLNNPSSCYLQVKWDWSDSQISNRWSTKQQVYRLLRVPVFDEDNLTFDNGHPVIITRNKVRGHGKAIQFRFENESIGSDFDLLGWAVPYSGNTSP
jgi:hypothetical protein